MTTAQSEHYLLVTTILMMAGLLMQGCDVKPCADCSPVGGDNTTSTPKPPLTSPSPSPSPRPPSLPSPTPSIPSSPTPVSSSCASTSEDCTASKCCSDTSLQCYKKDEYWAGCMSGCVPGIHANDPPEHQSPWSCTLLSNAPGSSNPSPTPIVATPSPPPPPTPPAQDDTPVARHGQLRVEGNRIVGAHGQPVQLRGMSLFWSQWGGHFWNKDVVNWLATDWKVSLVRAAMGAEAGGHDANPQAEEAKVVTVVDAAIDAGIYVLIDWHAHEDRRNEAKGFFRKMAQKYGSVPNVLFETFNEPIHQDWHGTLKGYHEEVVSVIRQYSQNIVVLGTRFYSSQVGEAADNPVAGTNLAYTMHFYASGHYDDYRNRVRHALSKGQAVFVTEWGTCEPNGNGRLDLGNTQTWLDFLAENYISDANWAIMDKDESCAALRQGAPHSGGWSSNHLSESGTWMRDSLRTFAGNSGNGNPNNPGNCASTSGDCTVSKCCSDTSLKCYEKDRHWAGCMDTCTPGIHANDPPQYQSPWSCKLLGDSPSNPTPSVPAPTPSNGNPPPPPPATGPRGPNLGSAMTTRYWDCCKPSCSWPGKAAVSNPSATCDIGGFNRVGFNDRSGCDGGNAFMCADASPWYDPITQRSYATAAANIKGLGEGGWCCACYELHLDNGKPPVVVHVTNTGGDLLENHFDILTPGGGFGLFDGCTRQWGASEGVWGARFGGVMSAGKPRSSCDAFPDALKEGCRWHYDYLGDNPRVTSFYRVQCPAELTKRSGCTRHDENNFGGGGGGGTGCCGWEGSCGDCGDDGSGWCHTDASSCQQCTGTWLAGKAKPGCR